jgi:hypothetical protein
MVSGNGGAAQRRDRRSPAISSKQGELPARRGSLLVGHRPFSGSFLLPLKVGAPAPAVKVSPA